MILCGLNREKVGENMTADVLQREIILSGPLYRNEINALLTGLTRCLEEGEKMLALDFSRVEYFDCAGLGALLYVHQQAQKRGARLVLKGVKGRVRYLIELARLDKVLLFCNKGQGNE